jgi:hypothetical protein
MTSDLPIHRFTGHDGLELAWREVGDGRPLVMLHGLMSGGAQLISLDNGPVQAIAARGRPGRSSGVRGWTLSTRKATERAATAACSPR